MLCESGALRKPSALYDGPCGRLPDVPLLHFNRAVALEDLERLAEALRATSAASRLDADLADAHFNAARCASPSRR